MNTQIIPLAEINKETFQFDTSKPINYYDYKELLVDFMKSKDISSIEASFSGSFDSGEIYSITGISDEIENTNFYGKRFYTFVQNFFNDVLDISGYDWYNDEGGHGNITINSSTNLIHLDINIARTEYDNYGEQY